MLAVCTQIGPSLGHSRISLECWPAPVFSPAKKDAPGRLGQRRGKTLVGGARRLVRPSPHSLHMLAYKKLTRRRGSACSAACRAALCSEHDPDGLRAARWRAERQKAPERHQKNALGSRGAAPGKTLVSGARLVRPSRPRSHMLAYKDLTRRKPWRFLEGYT
jgi:hypothetical protein